MYSHSFSTPLGIIQLKANQSYITNCIFLEEQKVISTKGIIPLILKEAEIQITQYFKGLRKQFNLPLAPKGTDFQRLVW
jgi:methylated-DNA-[protein]-cysteine S-methyltransferase